MHLNLFVRLAWMDYRLKYNSSNESDFIVAGGDIADKIWKPDNRIYSNSTTPPPFRVFSTLIRGQLY